MRRQRRKHDQDLRRLDSERLEMLDLAGAEGAAAQRFAGDLGKVEGHDFDFRRWREDLAERSLRRTRIRARDMRRGLLRDHPESRVPDWAVEGE